VVLGVSVFFLKLTSYEIYFWYETYLQEQKHFDKDQALDIFSLFSSGGIAGNLAMSLVSDLLPIRSIIFEIGAFFSSLMLILIATSTDTTTSPPYGYMASISFLLGMFLTGAMISASIIVCDIGKFVKTKYGTESVGTLTGIIHGVASFGSVFG